jgi:hypothetical protein
MDAGGGGEGAGFAAFCDADDCGGRFRRFFS